ncbi:unnamed protein product [Spodoptera littoralis]|uniref:ODAD1 central coiled coil region domain-containing protein n=1 Tax=Spodoptera littoralis TaxID=7109 RepID=A0A9P0I4P0_SPOLI|nr:unnamed protein product [Spodoptera littoralis]CAH1641312.1 unnamed protein product [Spodoptera littoralis]
MPPPGEKKPNQVEQKVVDPEAELSNAVRIYLKLAPQCTVAKRAGGIPQLAPQEKQLSILAHELHETLLCINLARKGQHAVRDANVKSGTRKSIVEYEQLESVLRDERAQQAELDCLNYLAQKNVIELSKKVPTEADELGMIENANNRLRRMENRLDLATKRNGFNIQWNRTIGKLVKGKLYLMDIFEIASVAFADRDECCRKLEALKWKGLFQLNRDISAYAGTERVPLIINRFQISEIENFSCFILLCQVLQESIILRREMDVMKQRIFDQRDLNEAREEQQDKRIANMTQRLEELRASTQLKQELNNQADATTLKVLKGIDELVKLAKCDCNPLMSLLGNHTEVTKWNVSKFLGILEMEVKSLIQVAYGAVKPPPPTPKGRKGPQAPPTSKLVADPYVEIIRPNRIEKLVPYQPCAYCVEDYIMNLVFETPAVPATKEYVESIFHLEDINTKFEIYTLTIPAKRHPFREKKD